MALRLCTAVQETVAQALTEELSEAVPLLVPEDVPLAEAQEVEEGETLAVVVGLVVTVEHPVPLEEAVTVVLLEVLTVGQVEAVAVTLPVELTLALPVVVDDRVEQPLTVGVAVMHIVRVEVLLTDVADDTVPPARSRVPVEQAVPDAAPVPALEVLALTLLLPEKVCVAVRESVGETLCEPENVWLLLLLLVPPTSASQGLAEPVPEVHCVGVCVGEREAERLPLGLMEREELSLPERLPVGQDVALRLEVTVEEALEL